MEDHVFTENKEVKKAKSYFKKNKSVMYVLLSLLILLGVVLTFSLVSSSKTTRSPLEQEVVANPEQYQQAVPVCNLDVQLVLDSSLSMNHLEADGRTKHTWAKEAMRGFINNM